MCDYLNTARLAVCRRIIVIKGLGINKINFVFVAAAIRRSFVMNLDCAL